MLLPHHLTALFAPGLEPASLRVRVGRMLRELTGCRAVSFARLDPRTRELRVELDPPDDPARAGLAGFARHMAKYPCFNFDPSVAEGRAFLRSDFLSDEEFYASDIYREGFRAGRISDHAAIPMPSHDGTIFFIGLERAEGVFGPEDRELLRALQPHLVNAVHLAHALTVLEHPLLDLDCLVAAGLSPREAEVLAWLANGKSNPEIAAILGIALPTVKTHLARVFDKLGVANRHSALLRAHEIARRGGSAPPVAAGPLARVHAPGLEPG